jgi:putative DNA methylase
VPDPDDPACPKEFKAAVEKYLKKDVPSALQYFIRGKKRLIDKDPYCPYEGMPDTLRNRLLCFVAKWSPEAIAFEKGENGKEPKPAELLDDRSLVKWETSDPDNAQGRGILRIARELVQIENNGNAPTVLDPFSGGGAIPLEAGRLGCQAIANDYNPVAYLILRATCEFPQKYGVPGKRQVALEEFGKKHVIEKEVPNILIHDLEEWAKWILARAEEKIGHLYPPGKDKRPVVGYLWARTAPCSNTTCKGQMPLLRSLLICSKPDKKVALTLVADRATKSVRFGIAEGKGIKRTDGTKKERGPVICPFCQQPTSEEDLRIAGQNGLMKERLTAVIVEGKNGKDYREVEDFDLHAFRKAADIRVESPAEAIEEGQWNIKTWLYGMKTWGSLFNQRQLVVMQTFVEYLHNALKEMEKKVHDEKYRQAVTIYLGLWISRMAPRFSNVGTWRSLFRACGKITCQIRAVVCSSILDGVGVA